MSQSVTEIASCHLPRLTKQDAVWILSLYGTAIGAGTLFLPINAGINGLVPLLLMVVLAFPLTYYSHRALCRFVLSGSLADDNITAVVQQHFGRSVGQLITGLYFFTIFPVILMYSVAITNTTQSFIVNQMGLASPPRWLLSIVLITGLMTIVRCGQQVIVKSMSFLVYPFVVLLMALSIYLIPHWSMESLFSQPLNRASMGSGLLKSIWLLIPVMVFSFNHSSIISSFAVSQKLRHGDAAEVNASRLLKYSHGLMVTTVMFFVCSCVLSLTPQDLMLAKQQNISILSYLANHFNTPVMAYLAPWIAFIAISKSFWGHYLGVREGMHSLMPQTVKNSVQNCPKTINYAIDALVVGSCWIVATLNPSILGMIESLSGPAIATILFLMPMYAIAKIPAMRQYRQSFTDGFVVLIGVIAISGILYRLVG